MSLLYTFYSSLSTHYIINMSKSDKIKDRDIRYRFLQENREFFRSGIFLNEYCIGKQNRMDVSLYKDDLFYGYEIKSEADNLDRLVNQLRNYVNFFDYLYIITFESHLAGIELILKKYNLKKVGIYTVNSELEFKKVKEAVALTSLGKTCRKLSNLKKETLGKICEAKGLQSWKNYKFQLINRLVGKLSPAEIAQFLKEDLEKYYQRKCDKCGSNINIVETAIIKFGGKPTKAKILRCVECDKYKILSIFKNKK